MNNNRPAPELALTYNSMEGGRVFVVLQESAIIHTSGKGR